MSTQETLSITDFLDLEEAVLILKGQPENQIAFKIGLEKIESYLEERFAGWCERNGIDSTSDDQLIKKRSNKIMSYPICNNEDTFRNAQLNTYLDGLCDDEEQDHLTVSEELDGCELPSGDYAYPCYNDCGANVIVQDPYQFDPENHVCGYPGCDALIVKLTDKTVNRVFKFENVSCSSCGEDFGPGDSGFSHCELHKRMREVNLKASGLGGAAHEC